MNAENLVLNIQEPAFQDTLMDIYLDEAMVAGQVDRYTNAVKAFVAEFGDGDLEVYSAPGRSEVGGNHTDHQRGKVLACSLNLDAIAVVRKTDDGIITVLSEGYPKISVKLDTLEPVAEEEGTSMALIRGVAADLKAKGYRIGGFDAYITSNVLAGSGMSSSAAYEVLIGTILSGCYNNMEISSVEVAKSSQVAENKFFGKPSGLLDQMACSVGGLVNIDFYEADAPKVHPVTVDFGEYGHSLCITDTKGSHADLTPDYAAVPAEMKSVAAYFGKSVLCEVDEDYLWKNIAALRTECGDRAVLRAIHWYEENKRVDGQVAALESGNFDKFLELITASGNSSYKYLQNVYSTSKIQEQGVSIGLAVSDITLAGVGAHRVHGGGFAGTIQAFVPNELVPTYKASLDAVFGEGACQVLKVRKYGGIKVL